MTCEALQAHLAARASGEDLPGFEALDLHLADCATCRETLKAWTSLSSSLGADLVVPDATRRDRLKTATRPRWGLRLTAVAAAILLVLTVSPLFRNSVLPPTQEAVIPEAAPVSAGDQGGEGGGIGGSGPVRDWKLAWLGAQPSGSQGSGKGGMFGGPGAPGKPGGSEDPGGPPSPWMPSRLPADLVLTGFHALNLPEGQASVKLFQAGERRLLLFEEKGGRGLALDAPWRTASFVREGLRVTLAAKGLTDEEWAGLILPQN